MKTFKNFIKTLIILLFVNFLFFETTHAQDRKKVDSLLNVLKSTPNDTSKVNLLLKVGYIYSNTKPDTALYNYNMALSSANKANSIKHIGICYNNIGRIHQVMGAYDKAIEYFLKSLKIRTKLGDKNGMCGCYINLGNTQFNKGDYTNALVFYIKSLKVYEELGNKEGLGIVYNNIGKVYAKQGRYDKSMEFYLKSLKICEESKNKSGMATVLANIASSCILIKKYNEGIIYAQKGLNIAIEIRALPRQKAIYNILTSVYDSLHDYKNAYKYHLLYKQINDSIFNQESSEQINNLQIKYETEKKEQEILLKDKDLEVKDLKISRMSYYFMLSLVIVLIALFIGFYIVRKNKFQLLIKNIKIEQKLLQSQMNPHFIFNSLNVIKSMIYQNKSEFAVKYLSHYATLTRMILDHSRNEYITLDKEIKMLELYLDLQYVRFEEKFKYSIEIDPEIAPEMVNIPPMLAQPFIENALEHGIMHKEEPGNIKISFKEDGDMLIFEVSDDGVGREKAKEIESKNITIKKHVSLATTITQERLENINKSLKRNEKIKLTITDLKDESGLATGTKVTFCIPMITI